VQIENPAASAQRTRHGLRGERDDLEAIAEPNG
jgi:hypothetical protein